MILIVTFIPQAFSDLKGTVIQIENALINHHLRISHSNYL